jgi:predicted PurR-regulated permease PerM
MKLKNYNIYFFFIVLLGVTVLAFFVLKPFIIPCFLAAVLAHLFFPLYKKLLKITKKKKGISAFAVILTGIILIVVPLTFLGSLIVNESQAIINDFSSGNNDINKIVSDGIYNFSHLSLWRGFQVDKFINQEEIIHMINNFSKNTVVILQGAYRSLSSLVLNVFIMLFAFFYFLIDGKRLVEKIKEISPIKDKYEDILLKRFNSIIKALMRETLLIAVIQGALSGILFWLTGVTSPIILGVIAAVLSFLPTVGAGIVWMPVGIVMIIIGHPIEGIIILLVGALVISTIDNFLRPKLMGKSSQMHPLLILLSTLGGLITFGLAGFIIGPILMALFLVMWEIYSLEFKEQLKEFNS